MDIKLNKKFNQEALEAHNRLRALHGAAPLKLNANLVRVAQNHAKHLARTNGNKATLESSGNTTEDGDYLGENLSVSYDPDEMYHSGEEITREWYDEMRGHNFKKEKFDKFSQV